MRKIYLRNLQNKTANHKKTSRRHGKTFFLMVSPSQRFLNIVSLVDLIFVFVILYPLPFSALCRSPLQSVLYVFTYKLFKEVLFDAQLLLLLLPGSLSGFGFRMVVLVSLSLLNTPTRRSISVHSGFVSSVLLMRSPRVRFV